MYLEKEHSEVQEKAFKMYETQGKTGLKLKSAIFIWLKYFVKSKCSDVTAWR